MNNKGFVTSFILFSLLILFLLITSIVLYTMNNSSSLNNKLKNDLVNDIDDIELNSSNFDSSDIYIVKTRGTYKVQVWSGNLTNGNYYAEGLIKLERGDKLHININTPNVEVLKNNINNPEHYIKLNDSVKQINGAFYNKIEPTNDSSKIPTDNDNVTPYVIIKGIVTAEDLSFDDINNLGCQDVQCALDEISNRINNESICKRVEASSSLHTYNGVTYGQIGTKGQLHSGDAFDCKVSTSGDYTERFYYVSDYYDSSTDSFDDKYATLIYYASVKDGEIDNTASVAYDLTDNYHGPRNAYKHLPKNSQWNNIRLYNKKRILLNELGTRTTSGGTLKSFDYSGYSARFLTYQELKSGCPEASSTTGSLDNCKYLNENTNYQNTSYKYGYWLETPRSSSSQLVWYIHGSNRRYFSLNAQYSGDNGVRPVIDVKKTYLEY